MVSRQRGMIRFLFTISLAILAGSIFGCEDKETNSVAKAQACLDKARSSSEAGACRGLIEGKSSQQAYIVRCSIEFVAGGLTTSKVADAFKAQKDNATTNKEAALIALLSLGDKTTADNAAAYCKLSGIPGLIYLANLSVIGTYMTDAISGFDPNNPSSAASLISGCANGGSGGVCDDAVIGAAVISIGESYCNGGNSDSDVCSKVNQALASTDGSPQAVANALYSQLAH